MGDDCIKDNVYWAYKLEDLRKQDKELIYFDITITNLRVDEEVTISNSNFKMEDSESMSYSDELTRDFLHGKAHIGEACRGGIAFAFYKNSKPKTLLYDTGFKDKYTGTIYYIVFNEIDKLIEETK